MPRLLEQVHVAAGVYRGFIDGATRSGPVDRLGLFGYRTSVLESEVIKPLVLYLQDPEESRIPEGQFTKVLEVVESWMVRRMLVRATTKSYSRLIAEMVMHLRRSDRLLAGDEAEKFLAAQTSGGQYWPDDAEVREELQTLLAYRRLGRGRLRMVLEAIEDYLRGWKAEQPGLGGERVARGQYAIEHVMPRKWTTHWPVEGNAADRDRVIHTLGNLTLLTRSLNAKVSNGPWVGDGGKRAALQSHDVLFLNRELFKMPGEQWTEELIRRRTAELADIIIRIWPVPANHRSGFSTDEPRGRKKVRLTDLISAGVLTAGMSLYPRAKKVGERTATLLADGSIEIDGMLFSSPSIAAAHLAGSATNGWRFFLVDPKTRRSLRSVRRDYVAELAVDADDDDEDDDA